MEQDKDPIITGGPEDSLEAPATTEVSDKSTAATGGSAGGPSGPKKTWWHWLVERINVYVLLLIFILLIALAVITGAYLSSKHSTDKAASDSKNLSTSALQQLSNSDASVGSSDQVLTVQSSAIFAGKVLARQDVEVAGNLHIGGSLALNGLSVSGTAQFGQAQVTKDLSVAGNTSLQGSLSAKSLQVSGGGNFGGTISAPQVSTNGLQLSGDLTLTRHIVTSGTTPNRSNGGALGSGGTSSISGNDTSGTITINTGSGPAAGCFITATFAKAFASTPRILITPVGSSAAGISYYVNRSNSGFSLCTTSAPPAGTSFGFDYFVLN